MLAERPRFFSHLEPPASRRTLVTSRNYCEEHSPQNESGHEEGCSWGAYFYMHHNDRLHGPEAILASSPSQTTLICDNDTMSFGWQSFVIWPGPWFRIP
jgi:hypothetical protein